MLEAAARSFGEEEKDLHRLNKLKSHKVNFTLLPHFLAPNSFFLREHLVYSQMEKIKVSEFVFLPH